MAKTVGETFGGLSRALKRLGFREVKKDGYIIFAHRSGRPVIVLPNYRMAETVEPIHQMMVWKQLTDAGLIQEKTFTGRFSLRPKKKIPTSALKTKA